MKTISPNITHKLWVLYSENNVVVSGLTDLTVIITDMNNTSVLGSTALTEEGSSGKYSYDWEVGNLNQETQLLVYFKKGSLILDIEEYYIDVESDNIGRAF